jgi:hypothetical protein
MPPNSYPSLIEALTPLQELPLPIFTLLPVKTYFRKLGFRYTGFSETHQEAATAYASLGYFMSQFVVYL